MSKYVMWQPEPMAKEEAIAAMAARVEAVKATEVDGKVVHTPPHSSHRTFVSPMSFCKRVLVCASAVGAFVNRFAR